jgi:hypothetical protein
MILTSNRGSGEWGDIFGDQVVATALLDRLLHHAQVVQIEGSSYRLREHAALVPENLKSQVCRPARQRTAAPARPSKKGASAAVANPTRTIGTWGFYFDVNGESSADIDTRRSSHSYHHAHCRGCRWRSWATRCGY